MPLRGARPGAPQAFMFLVLLAVGCSRETPKRESTLAIDVEVRADSAGQTLDVRPPARVWVARVAPARPSAGSLELAPPVPPDSISLPSPPLLLIDDDLKPPIPRQRPLLVIPASHARSRSAASVELDVRVDQNGLVSDALWVGGTDDPVLVQAATECALKMTFYPALQAGKSVPVWCRQRFDFGSSRP